MRFVTFPLSPLECRFPMPNVGTGSDPLHRPWIPACAEMTDNHRGLSLR